MWNIELSLRIARRLKQVRPSTRVVFGGPQVPDKPEAFLRQHPFIDIVVHNEGERSFLQLLDRLPGRNWEGLTGVSYLGADGTFFKAPGTERVKDLVEVPSPFLNGMFDDLVAANPQEKWIGLWETNRGCPAAETPRACETMGNVERGSILPSEHAAPLFGLRLLPTPCNLHL